MNSTVISIKNLSYKYPSAKDYAIKDISYNIYSGDRCGIFGPNGAGKTTLLSILCNVFTCEAGNVSFYENGILSNFNKMKNKIGFVPQNLAIYEELSAFQNLEYFGAMYNLKKNEIKENSERLLALLGLLNVKNNKVKTFSGGMKRRLNLIISVIHNPTLLFLDEPTVGVDIHSKNAIIEFLNNINSRGTTIIYTSHYLEEAEKLCNQIAILDYGRLIASDQTVRLIANNNVENLSELMLKLTGKELRDNV